MAFLGLRWTTEIDHELLVFCDIDFVGLGVTTVALSVAALAPL